MRGGEEVGDTGRKARMQIPAFEDALQQFRAFLRAQGHADTLLWAFRDDLYFPDRATCFVRDPLPGENAGLVEKVFEEGRAAGLVELKAIAISRDVTLATVWFPGKPEEAVQGWSSGMKLAIVEPPPRPHFIGAGIRWWLLAAGPGYRRYQRSEAFIATRAWARE